MRNSVQVVVSGVLSLVIFYVLFRMFSVVFTVPKEDLFIFPYMMVIQNTEYSTEVARTFDDEQNAKCDGQCGGLGFQYFCKEHQELGEKYCYTLCFGPEEYTCNQ